MRFFFFFSMKTLIGNLCLKKVYFFHVLIRGQEYWNLDLDLKILKVVA